MAVFELDAFTSDAMQPVNSPGPTGAGGPCDVGSLSASNLCGAGVAAVAGGSGFSSIQGAIDANSGPVAVCPGTHTEALSGEDIDLYAASGDASDTILDGQGTQTLLVSNGPVRVFGLTFRNGFAGYEGGAIRLGGHGQVACSVFEENFADYGGGAIVASDGLQVFGSRFASNTAGYEGGALSMRGDVALVGVHFTQNDADYSGGAVSWGDWDPFQLRVLWSHFDGNAAGYEGGAIEIGTWSYDQVFLYETEVWDTHSGSTPGAVGFGSWGGFDAVVLDSHFEGNDSAIGLNGWLEDGWDLEVVGTTIIGDPGNW